LKEFYKSLGISIPSKIEDYTIWKAEFSDDDITNVTKLLQWKIEKADSPALQEKLVELNELIDK
jgi:hypothetical protein